MNPSRWRVLFLIPTLAGGGAERVMVTILRHFDRKRFQPMLAVLNTRNAAFIEDVPADVEFIDLRCTRVRYALPKLLSVIRQRRPDVVLSTCGYLNLALALLRPLLPKGVRYVARETIILSAELELKKGRSWLWRAAYRHFYRRFDAVICQSRDMQKDLVHHFAVPQHKTVVINNPVDVTRIRELAKAGAVDDRGRTALRIVSAGRLDYQKGFDMLIDAVALSRRPILEVTILGEGPLLEELRQRAVAKGVAGQVRFAGFQKNPYPFFAQADVFVISSRFEGFPNVILEALACETHVIALPAPGGVREILEGLADCIVADEISAPSLARAIEQFAPAGALDGHVVERYDAEFITRQYEQELRR